jgi:hypothetical protein
MNNSTQKTTLYRYFDCDNRLLYVGITKNQFERQGSHARTQSWWPEVSFAKFEHFENRDLALLYEFEAIGREFPKYNKAGPVLDEHSRSHLVGLISNEFDDDWHTKIATSIQQTMMEVNEFSQKHEAHKLLFAFGEAIPWINDGMEQQVDCLNCQRVLDSQWYKKLFENVHSDICEESAR